MTRSLDTEKLEQEVKNIYRTVAETPEEEFHFEMGRQLAERLGYSAAELDQVPKGAIDSFAGVGYHFDFADLQPGDDVLDLGSGSGTDVFVAASKVGETGTVTGADMTGEQVEKARALRDQAGLENVTFERTHIEDLPFEDGRFDAVISNGVINLSSEKDRVFAEASRVLAPGGTLAVSDIISEQQMPESIKSDADLWAACIGGAMQVDRYMDLVQSTDLEVVELVENPEYEFISDRAASACQKYGVKSVKLQARK